MKGIPLSQGKLTIVNDEDFERLNRHKWYAHKIGNTYYVERMTPIQNGKRRLVYMHQEILRLPKGVKADHINGCGLDNRKQNLRIATTAENQYNQRLRLSCVSKYKGVSLHRCKKWQAQIGFNNKRIYLGLFGNEVEAAKAYDLKAKKLFGEFAWLNFP